uniref:Cytochrome P450 n=1 Tax=Setaria italica TaxID=4555 RepID=K3Y7H8_SETIT
MEILQIQYAALCGVALMIGWLLHWVYKWINPPCNGILPPGSMGFPFFGETIQFFKTSPSIHMPDFYKLRMKRYGSVFKTNLVGQPLVISADPEVNRFIFQQEGQLFRSWYPETANTSIGKKSIDEFSGAVQKFVRTFASRLFGLEYLKQELLPELENSMRDSFAEWATKPSIEAHEGATNGRKNMQNIMSDLLRQRLSTPTKKHGDLLDLIVEELQSEKPAIDEKFAIDALVALLFTSFVTMAPTLTLAFKFLSDNPKALEALKEEHEAIVRNRENPDSTFTWEEYKSLTFTALVVNELTRMSNVTPGIFRRTLTDVQVNGYTIPAGWMVMMIPMAIHLNPKYFDNPLNFNPWRWLEESKRSTLHKNFVPFGLGIRACPATEFSKLFIALFLHILVTKYRWKEIKGGEVSRKAVIMFPQGYQIQLLPKA